MTNDDEVWFVLIFGGLFIGLGFIFIVGQIYLYFFKMEIILSLLNNSCGVLVRKSFVKTGLFGVYFLLVTIGFYFLFPNRAIERGELDRQDYMKFPRGLLNLIRILYGAALVGAVAMLVLFFGGKYMGWIN